MMELYGRKYAANEKEVLDSLFQEGGTVNGTYKVKAAGIYLFDLQGKERVFIRKDGLGPVSVFLFEGKRRYAFSATTLDEHWLGKPESYTAWIRGADALALQFFPRAVDVHLIA